MAARGQNLILALGKGKQTNISTVGTTWLRLMKLNAESTSPNPVTETNAAEIGKGHEFGTQTFPSHYDVGNRVDKYGTSEFCTWAIAYGLGNPVYASGTYTITPIDPGTTLELPYFSIAEQIPEGGAFAADNVFVGCAIEEFVYSFTYGPGRASSKMNVTWVGSGNGTGTGYGDAASGVTIPALANEHHMSAGSLALTVNGVDYVAPGRIMSGSFGWKNNLLVNAGFFPGSGTKNGFQYRGRLEVGARVPSFSFSTRMVHGSTEYNTLVGNANGTTTPGTAVLSVSNSSTDSMAVTLQRAAFRSVTQGEGDGIVTVTVTLDPQYDATNGVVSVVAKCSTTGIAQ
jgi:hypothetical protein